MHKDIDSGCKVVAASRPRGGGHDSQVQRSYHSADHVKYALILNICTRN